MKSKRFTLSICVITAYIVIGAVGFYIYPEHITNLGAYMGATSIPVLGYMWAETKRPSKK